VRWLPEAKANRLQSDSPSTISDSDVPALEPIVAHGARMSWAGILRPGDEFPLATRSRLGVMTTEIGPALARCFGAWSQRYLRFTANLTSPRVRVRVLEPGQASGDGVQCVVHWVDRRHLLGTGPGTVCAGDGWPEELWRAFMAKFDDLPPGTVAERLRHFATDAGRAGEPGIVAEWRRRLGSGEPPRVDNSVAGGGGWMPVPADLVTPAGTSQCILSWAPNAASYTSLTEAMSNAGRRLDLASQASYYVECVLAKLHGIQFGPHDRIEDESFARRSEGQDSIRRVQPCEEQHVASAKFGRFDGAAGKRKNRPHRSA